MRRAVVLALVAACGEEPGMRSELVDQGRACVYGEGTGNQRVQQFLVGDPAVVRVQVEDICFSSSCTRIHEASCTITGDGAQRMLTTRFDWEDISGSEGICTSDCGVLYAECETGPLAAGTYQIAFGTAAPITIEVPSIVQAVPCF